MNYLQHEDALFIKKNKKICEKTTKEMIGLLWFLLFDWLIMRNGPFSHVYDLRLLPWRLLYYYEEEGNEVETSNGFLVGLDINSTLEAHHEN